MHLLRHGPSPVTDWNTQSRIDCDVQHGRVSETMSKEEGHGLQSGKRGNPALSQGLLTALSRTGVRAQCRMGTLAPQPVCVSLKDHQFLEASPPFSKLTKSHWEPTRLRPSHGPWLSLENDAIRSPRLSLPTHLQRSPAYQFHHFHS